MKLEVPRMIDCLVRRATPLRQSTALNDLEKQAAPTGSCFDKRAGPTSIDSSLNCSGNQESSIDRVN